MLAVIETHPIQYQAPVYRYLQQKLGIPVTVIYGSDFSIAGYQDSEFGVTFAWDADLLSGYTSVFLSRVANGGARNVEEVSSRGLWNALREISPSAALIGGYSPRFHQLAFYQAWRAGCPILFRGDAVDHAVQRSVVKAWVRDHVLRGVYRVCDKLLCIGQRSYQHFRRLNCPEEKLVFSPRCVDTGPFQCDEAARAQFRPAIRQSLNITQKQTVLLFSGKLSRRKGPDLLLRAVKQLPSETRKDVVVLFVGSGELQADLKELADTEPHTQAHFLGFQNQMQLSQNYHAADLLVLPSREGETWGLVVNEALHHGLPCVVSEAVGSGPDLIEPGVTGQLSPTDSLESLTWVIMRALPLIGRSEIRGKCREKVNGYTIEKAAAGISTAYWTAVANTH